MFSHLKRIGQYFNIDQDKRLINKYLFLICIYLFIDKFIYIYIRNHSVIIPFLAQICF